MTPEDIFGNPPNHPEVSENPEALRPASEATLDSLLEVMGTADKLIPKGSDQEHPAAIGKVDFIEKLNDGSKLVVRYVVMNTPDGLHIEKHVHHLPKLVIIRHINDASYVEDPSGGMKRVTDEQRAVLAENLLSSIDATNSSHALQDELGLTFVSEEEAQRLIDRLVNPTHP